MMICIGVGLLTFFAVVSFVAAGIGGFTLYYFFMQDNLKSAAELAFFAMIIACLLLLCIYLSIVLKAKKTTDELRHILAIAAAGGTVDDKRFEKFGSLGRGIKNLFYSTQDISEQRAKRIQFLNIVISSLFTLSEEPLLLLDEAGFIINASHSYIEKYVPSKQQADVLGTHIEKWYVEVTLPTLNKEMRVTRAPVSVKCEKCDLGFTPLFSTSNEPAGYLVAVGRTFHFNNKALSDTASKVAERVADGLSAMSKLKF